VIFVAEQLAAQARREHERRQQRRREQMAGHLCVLGGRRAGAAISCAACETEAGLDEPGEELTR
jgi:hypothetical protein